MKYQTSYDQSEYLPNKLNLKDTHQIGLAEFEGFLKAELVFTAKLTERTRFTIEYIQRIHQMALGELYDFAGKWRTVNLSKGGFVFAAAQFLPETLAQFEKDFLQVLDNKYDSVEQLVIPIAKAHAEFLFIHPFREGNGRTARLLANLMFRRYGVEPPDWGKINDGRFEEYVRAVQQVANLNYDPMVSLFNSLFDV